MAKLTFITKKGEEITLEGHSGTVMELAVQNHVQGIDGDCGGVCSCATCHVYVPEEYVNAIEPISEIEKDMLELDENTNEFSRLSCQLEINDALEGIVLRVAN